MRTLVPTTLAALVLVACGGNSRPTNDPGSARTVSAPQIGEPDSGKGGMGSTGASSAVTGEAPVGVTQESAGGRKGDSTIGVSGPSNKK